jgi:hypothetical protein
MRGHGHGQVACSPPLVCQLDEIGGGPAVSDSKLTCFNGSGNKGNIEII